MGSGCGGGMDSVSQNLQRVYELLEESLLLDDGDERIAVCEKAVQEAELSGDSQTRYLAREYCVRAYVFGGEPEKGLVGFSWLLAQFDNSPGEFSEWGILWKYKWILSLITNFPQIPKSRIYEMLDDFEKRSLRAGYSLHATYNKRYRVERFWDNKELALEYFGKMAELTPDELSNCPDCLRDEAVSFSVYVGNDVRAVELAQPLLDGERKCASVPHRTYACLLLPMIRLGRQREALDYQRAGYRLIANNKRFVERVSQHLVFLVLTGNFDRAVELFKKHYPWTEQNRDSFDRFHFFRSSWLLFALLAEKANQPLRLDMQKPFPRYSTDGLYDPRDLAKWFNEKAEHLATQFDARNETDFFKRTLNDTPDLKKFYQPRSLGHL